METLKDSNPESKVEKSLFAKYSWLIILVVVLISVQVYFSFFQNSKKPESVQQAVPKEDILKQIHAVKAIAESQPNEANYTQLGILFVNGQYGPEAVEANLKAISFNPNNYILYNNLGVSYNLCRNWDKAIEALNKSLSIQPEFEMAKNNLKWATIEKENFEKEVEGLKVKALKENSAELYSTLGLVYYKNCRYEESIEACKMAISLNPNSVVAMNNLCAALNNLGRWEEAIEVGKKAMLLDPNSDLTKNNVKIAEEGKRNAAASKK